MTLIDNGNIRIGLGRDREMKESAWTELLLKHGYAEAGESDRKRPRFSASKYVSRAPYPCGHGNDPRS
jgi:hypothetical protein